MGKKENSPFSGGKKLKRINEIEENRTIAQTNIVRRAVSVMVRDSFSFSSFFFPYTFATLLVVDAKGKAAEKRIKKVVHSHKYVSIVVSLSVFSALFISSFSMFFFAFFVEIWFVSLVWCREHHKHNIPIYVYRSCFSGDSNCVFIYFSIIISVFPPTTFWYFMHTHRYTYAHFRLHSKHFSSLRSIHFDYMVGIYIHFIQFS